MVPKVRPVPIRRVPNQASPGPVIVRRARGWTAPIFGDHLRGQQDSEDAKLTIHAGRGEERAG